MKWTFWKLEMSLVKKTLISVILFSSGSLVLIGATSGITIWIAKNKFENKGYESEAGKSVPGVPTTSATTKEPKPPRKPRGKSPRSPTELEPGKLDELKE